MQANSRVWKVLAWVVVLAVLVGLIFFYSPARTWFNLPSVKLDVQPNGTASIYGIRLPFALLQPAQIQQFQDANMQRVELRWSDTGLHPYVNGESMPYLAWDEASVGTLQEIVRTLPGVPYANLISGILPRLRTIGGGVRLDMPLAEGATALDIPRWNGDVLVTPVEAAEPTLGPLTISNVAFDAEGNGFVGSLPLSSLGAPVTLPPNVLSIINTLGIDSVTLNTEPDGLHIMLGDKAFPTIAYDEAHLQRAVGLANTLAPDAGLTDTLNSVAGVLPGADVEVAVSFTGEPIGAMDLSGLNVTIDPDGTVRALGVPIPGGPLLPASLLTQLQAADVQKLDVGLRSDGLTLVTDGQPLPAISWTPEGLDAVTAIVGPLAGMSEEQLGGIFDLVGETNLGLSVNIPSADGSAPAEGGAEAPAGEATFAPVDLGEFAPPVIRADLAVDDSGTVTSIGNLETSALSSLMPSGITLPANVMQILGSLGADEIGLTTDAGKAEVKLDGTTALGLQYDTASLRALLATIKPFLGVPLLDDPNIAKLIDEQIMPLAPGAQLDVTVAMP